MTTGDPPARDREGGTEARPYRRCVGIMLLNADCHVFVGKRIDMPGDHWQMPQGGIEPGETPESAAFRELQEEVGTARAELVATLPDWIRYDLPPDLAARAWGGRYRGQEQRWYAMRFLGRDSDIRLDAHKPEFSDWRWVPMFEVPSLIIGFKRRTYEYVVAGFRHLVPGSG